MEKVLEEVSRLIEEEYYLSPKLTRGRLYLYNALKQNKIRKREYTRELNNMRGEQETGLSGSKTVSRKKRRRVKKHAQVQAISRLEQGGR